MFDYIVSTGCSLAFGDELNNRDARYSKLISNDYGAELFDFSQRGASNEIISQKTINGILELEYTKKIDIEKSLIIVQWSFMNRLNYFLSKKKKYYNIVRRKSGIGVMADTTSELPNDYKFYNFYEDHDSSQYIFYNYIKNIHHTQSFLKSKNLKYVFVFSRLNEIKVLKLNSNDFVHLKIHPDTFFSIGETHSSIPYFYYSLKSIDKSKIFHTSILDYCSDKNFSMGIRGHPLEDFHEQYANLLSDHIKKLYGNK